MGIALHASFATHPGPWLKSEVLEPLGVDSIQLAVRLGRPIEFVDALLAGQVPVSAGLALQLEQILSLRADTLVAMQRNFDERCR
ncbi:addiction module HigA family antidote [Sphingomonas sp. JUb134]|nr:addiction module HigA family antidote [Sphingomonas sp. JUb134]